MSTTAAAPPFLNGASGAVPPEVASEIDFLQKLLQIRDDVLASKHPRIHLPAKVIEQVAPRPPQTTPSGRPVTNGTSTSFSPSNGISAPNSLPPRPGSSTQGPPQTATPPTQRPFSAVSASSSIDPVLLTKSDHLIRAELQLKRQQIERAVKDQFDRKGRGNDADEREAHLNVEECLIQAQLRVPPISGIRSTTNNSDGAESFDENSYYSSKADSWSSEEADAQQDARLDLAGPLTSHANQSASAHVQSGPAPPAVIDLDDEAYEPADDIEIYEPEPATLLDDAEEEDYSPPPADIATNEPSRGRARDRGPQSHGGANGSRRHSPARPLQPLQNPRKRRREEKRVEKKQRQQQPNKQLIRSPEPYIKEEPQSPPPFSESQPSKRRALQPGFAEVNTMTVQSPGRAQPVYYREPEPSARAYREYEEPTSPTVIHMPQRKVHRDEQDLRRVASLQYARRPYSPGAREEMFAEPRQIRSASHAFADRNEVSIYREASARPSAAPRYVRDHSRSPILEYLPRQQSPMVMAPPPRRIVVDQFGNKYYAAPVEARESAAPASRRIEVDPYYERAVTREPTMRAPRTEIYGEDAVIRMPPPPRRYVEGPEIIEAQPYRQREPSRRPVEIEYRPQYEEMAPPREYLPSRAFSMRPETIRREVPEGYVRHESIQPGSMRAPQPQYREVSVVREPVEERRYYSAAPQGRRYVEEEAMEVAAPEPRRVYTRY